MRKLPAALSLLALLAHPVLGQDTRTITLEYEVALHASADAASEIKATLAVGAVVEVISELDEWMAVSAPGDVVGWIEKAAVEGRATTPGAGPPAPPRQQTPPPPVNRPGVTPPPPPRPDAPPPRRPGATPSSTGGGEAGTQVFDDQGGLYGTGGWGRLAVASIEGGTIGGEIAYATMIGKAMEWGGFVGFDHRKEGMVPGGDAVPFTDPAFSTSVQDDDPVSSLTVAGALRYYILEPTLEAPIGVHLGGVGHFRQFFSATHFGVGDYRTITYGGEGGVFFRRPGGGVVRGAVQVGKIRYSWFDETFSESVVNFLAGVEPKIGGVILSAFYIRRDNENMVQVGLTFK